ncbi:MAG TPA: c-type cytochrome [Xanthomonadales bacterium]|nr:c-type cytochrome [Xanthomonadales bacterium]
MMLVADSVSADANLAAGRLRFSVCGACHGLQGQGNEELGAPRIAGLPAWYTARQLQSFSNGMRGGPESDRTSRQMTNFALNLSAADIANLSAYLESLPRSENLHEASDDADAEEAGHAAYQQCASCHGPNAEGAEALGAPPLRGLNAWYFKKQLNDFRSGIRGYSATDTFAESMRAIAQSIDTKETADAIAAYLHIIER